MVLSLHRLIDFDVIEKDPIAVLPGITESVDEKGRFAGIVERLRHVHLVHQLVIDENRDTVQVATDLDAVDIFG